MKPDLATLEGQRTATRRGVYVALAGLALGVLWAVLASYPEHRLQAAALICFVGGCSVGPITVLREMSLRQGWIDAGSAGSRPKQSAFWKWCGIAAFFLGFLGAGILMVLSGTLYPHWHSVYRNRGPWYAITLGSLMVVASFGSLLPAIYKAHFRKA